jgi:chemotaxis response regulator CheB
VVDDSVAYGLLVSAWFGGDAEIDVVATLRTEHEALQTLTATRPDAVMLDHLLPSEEHSRRVIAHIRAELPGTAVILISGMPAADTHAIRMAIRAGCMGRVRDR